MTVRLVKHHGVACCECDEAAELEVVLLQGTYVRAICSSCIGWFLLAELAGRRA